MKKKILALLMSLALVVALLPTAAMAVSYSDVNGHWAQSSIERWSDYEVVQGYDGKFAPNGYMTRAQAAAVFTRLLKLNKKADLSVFSDVGQGAWYDEEIAKCVGAGIMNGVSATKMDPNGTITREMFFVMFARAMGIDGESTLNKPMADSAKVSSWAKGAVNALINAGYVSGITEDAIAPALDINRASVMALLDKTISTYVTESGVTVEAKGYGVTLIVADNVTVTGKGTNDLIVIAKENANVSLKGYKGVPTINVVADKVVIKDAPVGTEINTTANVTAIVNGYQMSKDDQHIVPGTPAVSGGSSSGGSSCEHENTTVTYTKDEKVETCDNKKCGYEITYPAVACTTVDGKTTEHDVCAYTAVYSDGSFYAFADTHKINQKVTVQSETTGVQFEIDGVEIDHEVPEHSFEKTVDTKLVEGELPQWNKLFKFEDDEGYVFTTTTVVLNLTSDTLPNPTKPVTVVYNVTKDATVKADDGLALIGAFDEGEDSEDIQTVLKELLANKHDMGTTQDADSVIVDEGAWAKDKKASYTLNNQLTVSRNSSRREVFENVTQSDNEDGKVAGGAGKITVNAKGKQYVSYGFEVGFEVEETDVPINLMTLIWNFAKKDDLGEKAMTKIEFLDAARAEVNNVIKSVNGNKLVINLTLQNKEDN